MRAVCKDALPKHWIVERTFTWLSGHRRLSKDDETLPDSSKRITRITMIHVMLHRIQPG